MAIGRELLVYEKDFKGKTKAFIENLYANDFINVNSENKVVQKLKKLGVIYSKEIYDEGRIK